MRFGTSRANRHMDYLQMFVRYAVPQLGFTIGVVHSFMLLMDFVPRGVTLL